MKNSSANNDAQICKQADAQRPFSKRNFLMMGACLLLIVVGFLLMSGPGSSVENGFNPDIFSTRRIVVGPTLAFLGFLLMAFAIIAGPCRCRRGKKADAADVVPGEVVEETVVEVVATEEEK